MAGKIALFLGTLLLALTLLYVAASGPALRHIAAKKGYTVLLPSRFHPQASIFSSTENLYLPLFDAVDKSPFETLFRDYLHWWGVDSMRVCSNIVMISPRRSSR